MCLEIHAANETCAYLLKLIHEIGLELRSSAVCTGLRRLRYGHFTWLSHALLVKHCDARSIAENVEFCRPIINELRQTQHTDIVQQTTQGSLDQLKIGSKDRNIDYEDYIDDDDDDLAQLSWDSHSTKTLYRRFTVIWATNHLGDSQLGDNQLGDTFRSTGRHDFDYLGDSVGSVIYLRCWPNNLWVYSKLF